MNYTGLWMFWIGCSIGSTIYGLFMDKTVPQILEAPYWIAFTILCIQYLGVGKQ